MKREKNAVLWVILVILLLFNSMLLYKYQQKERSQDMSTLLQELDKNTMDINEVKQMMLLQQQSEASSCANVEIKNPETKENVPLSFLLKDNKPVLFFRFKETDCDACIGKVMQTLTKMAKYFPENGIVILSGYNNVRQFYAYAQACNSHLKIYNVNQLPVSIDKQSVAYFFVLTPELKMQNIFIPDEADSKFIAQYLECVRTKYWNLDN
jgi:hypothetical protein